MNHLRKWNKIIIAFKNLLIEFENKVLLIQFVYTTLKTKCYTIYTKRLYAKQ